MITSSYSDEAVEPVGPDGVKVVEEAEAGVEKSTGRSATNFVVYVDGGGEENRNDKSKVVIEELGVIDTPNSDDNNASTWLILLLQATFNLTLYVPIIFLVDQYEKDKINDESSSFFYIMGTFLIFFCSPFIVALAGLWWKRLALSSPKVSEEDFQDGRQRRVTCDPSRRDHLRTNFAVGIFLNLFSIVGGVAIATRAKGVNGKIAAFGGGDFGAAIFVMLLLYTAVHYSNPDESDKQHSVKQLLLQPARRVIKFFERRSESRYVYVNPNPGPGPEEGADGTDTDDSGEEEGELRKKGVRT